MASLFVKCFQICSKICEQQDIIVHDMKMHPRRMTFTRWLVDDWRMKWEKIMDVTGIQLTKGRDIIRWKFGCNDKFSVKSVYNAMTETSSIFHEGKIHIMNYNMMKPIVDSIILSYISRYHSRTS